MARICSDFRAANLECRKPNLVPASADLASCAVEAEPRAAGEEILILREVSRAADLVPVWGEDQAVGRGLIPSPVSRLPRQNGGIPQEIPSHDEGDVICPSGSSQYS